jgi:hypothetical protein
MDALLQSLLLPPEPARHAWESWRANVDIDAMPWACHQLLPALNPRLSAWLQSDPAASIFQGIVRMVWTQNQVYLRKTAELAHLLKEARVEQPAVVGPAAWSLGAAERAIRAIPWLSFLVARADIGKAVEALIGAGWQLSAEVPAGEALDWCDHLSLVRENLSLNLHWRLIPVMPEETAACEEAFLRDLAKIEWKRQILLTTSPEATLLHMLCDRRDYDLVPWQADVALADTARVDWARFQRLAKRFGPLALERLQELRDCELVRVPELPVENPASLKRLVRFTWNEYRARSYHCKQAANWRGFVRFLASRWRVRSAWQVPIAGARRVFQHRRSQLD